MHLIILTLTHSGATDLDPARVTELLWKHVTPEDRIETPPHQLPATRIRPGDLRSRRHPRPRPRPSRGDCASER